jgi:phospholipid-binding lipoprotein MlaA
MRTVRRASPGGLGTILLLAVSLALLSGCGSFSGLLKSDDEAFRAGLSGPPEPTPATDGPEATVEVAVSEPAPEAVVTEQAFEPTRERDDAPTLLSTAEAGDVAPAPPEMGSTASALAQGAQDEDATEATDEEYDPWESFNEKIFTFNRNVDRFVLKPVARAYMFIMPEPFQVLIANGFDNVSVVPRVVNNLLQGKWSGAGREAARFLINSTAGIGGLFDPAKDFWGIQKSREDFGQTLGVWGSGPGPYLIVPFMEPLTVRDGIGKAVDGLMDPLSYLLPLIWTRLSLKLGDLVNERALNYDLFQGFEESVIDMYSAVRQGYLQRRRHQIRE